MLKFLRLLHALLVNSVLHHADEQLLTGDTMLDAHVVIKDCLGADDRRFKLIGHEVTTSPARLTLELHNSMVHRLLFFLEQFD